MHTVHSVQRDNFFLTFWIFIQVFFIQVLSKPRIWHCETFIPKQNKKEIQYIKKHQMYIFSKKQRLLQYLQCFINKIKNPSIIVKHAALGLLWGKRSKWFSSSCQSAPWKEKTIYKKESDLIKKKQHLIDERFVLSLKPTTGKTSSLDQN